MLEDIGQFFIGLFQKLFKFLNDLVLGIWETVKTFFLDIFYALYDLFLSIFSGMITSIPVPSSWVSESPLNSLPVQTLYVLYELGILQFFAIIFSAWLIRFTINLIPSWATRA